MMRGEISCLLMNPTGDVKFFFHKVALHLFLACCVLHVKRHQCLRHWED